MKREPIYRHYTWPARQSARVAIFEYIEAFYNTTPPAEGSVAVGHLSFVEYEEARMKGEAVAERRVVRGYGAMPPGGVFAKWCGYTP